MKITIENCGKIFAVLCLGVIAGTLCFVLWAALEHGAQ
jgi:hypothetical protein